MKLIYKAIAFSMLFGACHSSNKDEKHVVEEWVGKEIILPPLAFHILGDTVDLGSSRPDFRIVNYIDSSGCTSCKMKLQSWDETLDEFNSIPNIDVESLTIVNTSDTAGIGKLIRTDNYLHPVAFDTDNTFCQANNLPYKNGYHTFLLDSDNNVLAIGNPVYNPKIKALYKRIILTDIEEEDDISKLGKVDTKSLGVVKVNDMRSVSYRVVNNDSSPLTIQAIIPSCDCVEATVSSNKISPHSAVMVDMSFRADSVAGSFNKYVDIFYNEKENPDRLIVYGFVK